MSVSALALIRKFAKTPTAASGVGTIATDSNFSGIGSTSVLGGTSLGSFTGGRPYLRGKAVFGIYSHTSNGDLVVGVHNQGAVSLAIDSFSRLYYQDAGGTWQSILSSAATFLTFNGTGPTAYAQWTWTLGAPVWSSADNGETKAFYILP